MADFGAAGLGIVGAVIGNLIVPGIGGYLGFALGSLAGQALFPVKLDPIQGPRIGDVRIQSSALGSAIPVVYGTDRIAGNVLWSSGIKETENTEELGGKGGPTQTRTTYTYRASVAIGVCEGPITGITRIWADAVLIYDKRGRAPDAIVDELERALAEAFMRFPPGYFLNNLARKFEIAQAEMAARAAAEAAGRPDPVEALRARQAADAYSEGLDIQIYVGDEEQLPDPTIEAEMGSGNVPAYRGLAYVVFPDFELARYGNRVPSFSFEVTAGLVAPPTLSVGEVYPWEQGANPLNVQNVHGFAYHNIDTGNPYFLRDTLQEAIDDAKNLKPEWFDLPNQNYSAGSAIASFSTRSGDQPAGIQVGKLRIKFPGRFNQPLDHWYGHDPARWIDRYQGVLNNNEWVRLAVMGRPAPLAGYDISLLSSSTTESEGPAYPDIDAQGEVWVVHPQIFSGTFKVFPFGTTPEQMNSQGYVYESGKPPTIYDIPIYAIRRTRGPVNPCLVAIEQPPQNIFGEPQQVFPPKLPENPDYCVIDGLIYGGKPWQPIDPNIIHRVLRRAQGFGPIIFNPEFPENNLSGKDRAFAVGPIILEDPFVDYRDFWEAEYNKAVQLGFMPSGLVYQSDYPLSADEGFTSQNDNITSNNPTVLQIVKDISSRAGINPETIVTDTVSDTLVGYTLTRVMSAKDAVAVLQQYAFFDIVESANTLRLVKHGGPIVATLSGEDLRAKENAAEEAELIEINRAQDSDLPKEIRVHYLNREQNYSAGVQSYKRITAPAINSADAELRIVMTDQSAANIAQMAMAEAWIGRTTYSISAMSRWSVLEVGDVIAISLSERDVYYECRIITLDFSVPGIVKIMAVRQDNTAYAPNIVAAPALGSNGRGGSGGVSPGTTDPTNTVPVSGPTTILALDIPALKESDNDAGYYVAAYGVLDRWPGASIFASIDGGANYQSVAATQLNSTVGFLLSALPAGPTSIIDEGNTVRVLLESGTLSSTNEIGLLNFVNGAAIGINGRWEIIQFRDAALNANGTYTLSGFHRGRLGTEWAVGLSQQNDNFVLLNTGITRVASGVSMIGRELRLKGVTAGTAIQLAESVPFTPQGVALKPYSVADVEWDEEEEKIKWRRRSRLYWPAFALPNEPPLNEESEKYEIDFFNGTALVETFFSTVPELLLPSASALTSESRFDIYQISAIVGRGYVASINL